MPSGSPWVDVDRSHREKRHVACRPLHGTTEGRQRAVHSTARGTTAAGADPWEGGFLLRAVKAERRRGRTAVVVARVRRMIGGIQQYALFNVNERDWTGPRDSATKPGFNCAASIRSDVISHALNNPFPRA